MEGFNEADSKRKHHNALERRRRDFIKDSFEVLRCSVPELARHDKASRSHILNVSTDYIMNLRKTTNVLEDKLKHVEAANSEVLNALEQLKGNPQAHEHIQQQLSTFQTDYESLIEQERIKGQQAERQSMK
eukprot:m.12652 g.12652  ORF g.12652 m.12652 type:complete len:131 (-) comp7282_c0_seq3:1095-1487(-)